MAKLGFAKLGLKVNNEKVLIQFNDQTIEVKQYLQTKENLELISCVLTSSHDQNNFSNPIKLKIYSFYEIVNRYTNISFTDKQKEDLTKLYDLMESSGLREAIIAAIPEKEYTDLMKALYDTVDAVYKYQNSALGILDALTQDYGNAEFDIESLTEKLTNPEALSVLKGLTEFVGYEETQDNN